MISIIVAVYNVEKYISTAIQSVISQNVDYATELILVDDGSTDASPEICDNFAANCGNIKVIHKENGGLSSARNAGLEVAKGDYVLFLDGDDCYDESTIKALSNFIQKHKECDVIQFGYEEVLPASPFGHIEESSLENYYECYKEHDFFMQLYEQGGVAASACTKLIRRKLLQNLRFKEGIIHEDELFTTELLKRCSCIGYCTNKYYKYVMREGSITHNTFSADKLIVIDILEDRIQYLKFRQYEDIVDLFQTRLFFNLCLLWQEARDAKDKESMDKILRHLNFLCDNNLLQLEGLFANTIYKASGSRGKVLNVFYLLRNKIRPFIRKKRNFEIKIKYFFVCYKRRHQLKGTDFSIISNNCWGGMVYQYFGLKYLTPTVGLFIMDNDYIRFLENLEYYLAQPLKFIEHSQSRYQSILEKESTAKRDYPIGLLDDVEIHFLHYHSEEECLKKWNKRLTRLNKKRLLVKWSQRSTDNAELLDRFEKLPFKNKVCFTKYHRDNSIFITIEALSRLNVQGGDETPYVMEKVNLLKLINSLY